MLRTHFHRAALAALLVIVLVALTGCSAISQGLARGSAAISGPELIQGKLGHVAGLLTYVAATANAIAHYELALDGADGRVYNGIIEDAEIVASLIKKGVAIHDKVSFAGVEVEAVWQMAFTEWMDDEGTVHKLPPESDTPKPIDLKITRLKLRR